MLTNDLFSRYGCALALCILCCMCLSCSNADSTKVSVDFEGGAAEKVRIDSSNDVHFSIPPDPVGNERLWFYFRVTSAEAVRPWFILENEPQTHQGNWDVVRPVFSADGSNWVRAQETHYGTSALSRLLRGNPVFRFRSPFAAKDLWVAYFYPYTARELRHFLDALGPDDRIRFSSLGRSEEQRTLQTIVIEDPRRSTSTPLQDIWIVCREHPGETPASFVLEGIINALLKQPAGQTLLSRFRFHIVPIFNVDGVARGNYYRNSNGIDIAQDWGSFKSAEVRALHEAMREDLAAGRVSLVFNLHSANDPRSHFLLETPPDRLPARLRDLQSRLIQASDGIHPQLQITKTVKLWDHPVIAANYLSAHYGVYCFYSESNYSIGADGTVVTRESLRNLGAAFVRVLAKVMAVSQ